MTDLDVLEGLAKAATPGEWSYEDNMPRSYGASWVNAPQVRMLARCDGTRWSDGHGFCLVMKDQENEANARLIAAAVNALPDLIAAARERDGLRVKIEKALADVAYVPGDNPIVPIKHAAFVEAIRAALTQEPLQGGETLKGAADV